MRKLAAFGFAATLPALLAACEGMAVRDPSVPEPGFFITSTGSGDGANLGGLEGADAHCATLAGAAGLPAREWRAYLSAGPEGALGPVNAAERIGYGPWYNVNGQLVAASLAELHGEAPNFQKTSALNEMGGIVNGRGDDPNRHDILTGSNLDGTLAMGEDGAPLTCSNWTANGPGSAQVGHFDRTGGGANPESWVSAHASRGCSQSDLEGTGGAGYFYCFAAD